MYCPHDLVNDIDKKLAQPNSLHDEIASSVEPIVNIWRVKYIHPRLEATRGQWGQCATEARVEFLRSFPLSAESMDPGAYFCNPRCRVVFRCATIRTSNQRSDSFARV